MSELEFTNNLILELPNLYETPYCVVPYVIDSKDYFFEFTWSIRQEKCYLSIYYLENQERVYLIKNRLLKTDLDLTKFARNENWKGLLFLYPYNDSVSEYNIKNFHTDFALMFRKDK